MEPWKPGSPGKSGCIDEIHANLLMETNMQLFLLEMEETVEIQ